MIDEKDVQRWLDQYGEAWVKGAPALIVPLFTQGASYRETPFDAALQGQEAIRRYWQDGAADAQEQVTFAAQVWAVNNLVAVAGWQAQFTRRPSGTRIELDGTFRLKFCRADGRLLCESLEEWWHRREI